MLHELVRRLRRLVLAGVSALIVGTSVVSPVAARESVDPASLNPPPPDFINPECAWSGNQVICSFGYAFTVTDAPTGVICDGDELLETSDRYVFGQRVYNADLNMVERRYQERIEGVVYDPVTGVAVHWTGIDGGIQLLSVPGDRDTGTNVNSGAIIHVYLDSGRSVMLAAGRTFEDFDTGAFWAAGTYPSYSVCDAIAANG